MAQNTDDKSMIELMGTKLSPIKAKQLNILTLAYLGDCVQDFYVRSHICTQGADKRINTIHKSTVCFVSANAQSDCADYIQEELNEVELSVYKRGRNSKSMPTKNTDRLHYSKATGLEAVLGYLYVSGQDDRLTYILNKCYKYINEGRKEFWDKQGSRFHC